MHESFSSIECSGVVPEPGQWVSVKGNCDPVKVSSTCNRNGSFVGEHIVPIADNPKGVLVRKEYQFCFITRVIECTEELEKTLSDYGLENYLLTSDQDFTKTY